MKSSVEEVPNSESQARQLASSQVLRCRSRLLAPGCRRPRSASAALATAQPVGRDRTSPENPDVAVSLQPGPGPGSKRPHC